MIHDPLFQNPLEAEEGNVIYNSKNALRVIYHVCFQTTIPMF